MAKKILIYGLGIFFSKIIVFLFLYIHVAFQPRIMDTMMYWLQI